MKNIEKLIVSILVCQLVGFFGSLVTLPAIPTWYQTLEKPTFNPPSWVFGPVWTTLFLLMGISAYLIWKKGLKNQKVKIALLIFLVQLGFNFFWSFLFFSLHSPFLALVDIILLWLAILATIISFWKLAKPAAYLLFPYLFWVSFAAVLNYFIYRLN